MVNPRKGEREGILDLDAMIKGVVDSGIDPSYFGTSIEMPRANNIVEFSIHPDFLNSTLLSKQAEQAVKLFCEWCPECSDKDYMENVPVDDSIDDFRNKITLLNKNICPKCGKNRRQLFDEYPCELVSCLGQRSGKTVLAGGIISSYVLHRFLLLPNPAKYYKVKNSTLFMITFVAVTAKQAEETLWVELVRTLEDSPWFNKYNEMLRKEEKEKGLKRGTLVKTMDTYIWYGNKRLSASFHSADKRTLRGRTRLIAAIDELGHFNVPKDYKLANADETYLSLNNSLRTVRSSADRRWEEGDYDALCSYMLNISSPNSQYDKIMSLLKDGENDSRKRTFHWATWEANPQYKKEDFHAEEINDPIGFWRDFGAVPPLASNPFISNEKAVYSCRTEDAPLFHTQKTYIEDGVGEGKFVAAKLLNCSKDKQTARIVTCDAGEKGNHFVVALHHIRKSEKNITEVHLDGVVEVAPEEIVEKNEIIAVHFPTMFDIVLDLCKHFNILVVLYDRWNSSSEVQRLRDVRVKAEQKSPRWQDFVDFRNLVYSECYKTPKWEKKSLTDLDLTNTADVARSPYIHAAVQMATVRESGKKVIKPEFGEDDIFRASVLATSCLLDEKWQKKFLQAGVGSVYNSRRFVGSVRMSNSASSSVTGSSNVGSVRFRSGRTR